MRTTFCEKAFPLLEVTTILFKNCDLNLTQFKREEGVENLCHSRAERVSLCLLQEVSVTCIIIDFVNFILTFFYIQYILIVWKNVRHTIIVSIVGGVSIQ